MSIQTLSAKSTRRLARDLHEPTITRAWVGTNHHIILWATWDHVHGWYNRRTGERGVQAPESHMLSCHGPGGALLLDLDPFDDDGHWPTLRD